MKCPNCGKEIAEDSKFCEFCGKQISNTQQPSTFVNADQKGLRIALIIATIYVLCFSMFWHIRSVLLFNGINGGYSADMWTDIFSKLEWPLLGVYWMIMSIVYILFIIKSNTNAKAVTSGVLMILSILLSIIWRIVWTTELTNENVQEFINIDHVICIIDSLLCSAAFILIALYYHRGVMLGIATLLSLIYVIPGILVFFGDYVLLNFISGSIYDILKFLFLALWIDSTRGLYQYSH